MGQQQKLQCHLYVAIDQNYISKEEFEKLYTKTEEILKMIQGFMNYLDKLKILNPTL